MSKEPKSKAPLLPAAPEEVAVAPAVVIEPTQTDSASSPPKKPRGSAELAAQIVAGTADPGLGHYAKALEHENPNTAAQAARVFEEVIALKPVLCAPYIERLVRGLLSENARVVQAGSAALPVLARLAPAKVARHLEKLRSAYEGASEPAREGMVGIFVSLCLASVAYQRRVVDVLEKALGGAEPATLLRWTEQVLPALKGEPHAQARAVVERRLYELPRPQAEKLAAFLGVRLRSLSSLPPVNRRK